ncbi:MAG: 3'-5' exonuclease [Proteobacteria bacterium]|nr:3'-5' exonuclease [Pseudomonadota bacterium]
MPRSTYFCVDIECSGPVPALYDMISLGAVRVVETDAGHSIGEPFYVEIKPRAPRVDAGAMAVNGLDLAELEATALPMAEALDTLTAWVKSQTLAGSVPVFVGHNAPFDWSFVNYAYHANGRTNPFGYKALDTKALATGTLGLHWLDSNKETLETLLDLPPQDAELVHRADYDAAYQALILVRLLERSPCVDS